MQIDGSELPSESRTTMTALERWAFPAVVGIIALIVVIGVLATAFQLSADVKQQRAQCDLMRGEMKDGMCIVVMKDFPKH